MELDLSFFKAYDLRGTVPEQLNDKVAYDIGRAFATYLSPTKVIVGHDIRLSSESLANALCEGLLDSGVDVVDIGECGTEEVYFSVFDLDLEGGICVTASHNPKNYNGMKLVKQLSRPIGSGTGLEEIKRILKDKSFTTSQSKGVLSSIDRTPNYIEHLLRYIDIAKLKALRLVVNPGNGGAGKVVQQLSSHLPFEFKKVHFLPDGNFPNGVPNPLLVENRQSTSQAVLQSKADFGIAWDGDFDRCFFFDELGEFIEGYYIVSLLAKIALIKSPNSAIVYDPRLYWATEKTVSESGGSPIVSPSGHAFMKDTMRKHDAAYGGEMSAHHYFRDFAYCDNGTIPWLLIAELVSNSNQTLSELVAELKASFPCSGEINLTVNDSDEVLRKLHSCYASDALQVNTIDGLDFVFDTWRFNVRQSNTEPLLRVNVEVRSDLSLLELKTAEVLGFIESVS
jgi:phosphomannomutase